MVYLTEKHFLKSEEELYCFQCKIIFYRVLLNRKLGYYQYQLHCSRYPRWMKTQQGLRGEAPSNVFTRIQTNKGELFFYYSFLCCLVTPWFLLSGPFKKKSHQ